MRGHVRAVKGVVERQGAPGLVRLDLFLNNPGSLTNLWVVKLQRLRVCSTTSAARAIAPVPGQVVNSVTERLDVLVPKQKNPCLFWTKSARGQNWVQCSA